MPPPKVLAALPEMVQPTIVNVQPLLIAPPTWTVPLGLPLEIVRPEMVTLMFTVFPLLSVLAILNMRKLAVPLAALRCTLSKLAPGPLIVRSLSIIN